MNATATIESVMTPFPYAVDHNAGIATARSLMAQFGIHHLPVHDQGHFVGVITARDVAQAERLGVKLGETTGARAADIATGTVVEAAPADRLVDVLRRMCAARADAAVVLSNGELAGIFTATDACKRFAEWLDAKKS